MFTSVTKLRHGQIRQNNCGCNIVEGLERKRFIDFENCKSKRKKYLKVDWQQYINNASKYLNILLHVTSTTNLILHLGHDILSIFPMFERDALSESCKTYITPYIYF